VFKHYAESWMYFKEYLQNKKCIDIGIHQGMANKQAKSDFNLETSIGIEPSKQNRAICKRLMPNTILLKDIDHLERDYKDTINTDVILMLGVIGLFGKEWKNTLARVFQKIDAPAVLIRQTFIPTSQKVEVGNDLREYNMFQLKDFSDYPQLAEVDKEIKKYSYEETKYNPTDATVLYTR